MTRGRKRLLDRPIDKTVSLPESITLKVELLLLNPRTNRPKHGAWANLITELLREWLKRQGVSV